VKLVRAEGVKLVRAEGVELVRAEGVELVRAEGVKLVRVEGVKLVSCQLPPAPPATLPPLPFPPLHCSLLCCAPFSHCGNLQAALKNLQELPVRGNREELERTLDASHPTSERLQSTHRIRHSTSASACCLFLWPLSAF
jgi:hypothetical protein